LRAIRYNPWREAINDKITIGKQYLVAQGKSDKMMVRVPHIPNFNTPEEIKKSIFRLNRIEITEIDECHYLSDIKK
jgi:hypothetical protein